MPNRRKEFGDLLRALRNSKGWSQDKLSEELEVTRQTITTTERGRNVPKAEVMNKAYKIFRSDDLIKKYLKIQENRNELFSLASMLIGDCYSITRQIIKQVIRTSFDLNDLHTVASSLFQLIIWDLKMKQKVNNRKIEMVIKVFDVLESDQFADLLIDLYNVSFNNNKNFEAYIRISKSIKDELRLDNRKLSLVLNKTASAYYYSNDPHEAYITNRRAIEVAGDFIYPHCGDIFNRHGLICLQLEKQEEAITSFNKCIEVTTEQRLIRLATLNLARSYYFQKSYDQAKEYWDRLFKMLGKNELSRINSLNDIIMMHIKLNDLSAATHEIKETERLLKIAKDQKWSMYTVETILLRRSKVLLDAIQKNDFTGPEVSLMLDELETTHLRDELVMTKNFVLDKILSSSKIESS